MGARKTAHSLFLMFVRVIVFCGIAQPGRSASFSSPLELVVDFSSTDACVQRGLLQWSFGSIVVGSCTWRLSILAQQTRVFNGDYYNGVSDRLSWIAVHGDYRYD